MPDLTVKSAVTPASLRRFPSDLLETSVDPEENFKDQHQSNDECGSSVTPVPGADRDSSSSEDGEPTKDFQFTPSTLTSGSTPVDQEPPQHQQPPPDSSSKSEEMVRVYQAPPGTSGHNAQAAATEVVNGNVRPSLN